MNLILPEIILVPGVVLPSVKVCSFPLWLRFRNLKMIKVGSYNIVAFAESFINQLFLSTNLLLQYTRRFQTQINCVLEIYRRNGFVRSPFCIIMPSLPLFRAYTLFYLHTSFCCVVQREYFIIPFAITLQSPAHHIRLRIIPPPLTPLYQLISQLSFHQFTNT